MAIAAQRFKFLNEQTNLPVKDFFSINTSDILSRSVTDITGAISGLANLVGAGNIGGTISMLGNIAKESALETKRLTRDFYSSLNSISNWTSQEIHAASAAMFPNDPVIQNAFNQIGDGCKAKILSGLSNCVNKRRLSEINGLRSFTNDRSCSAASFTALINKITKGLYAPTLTDQCALMKMVAGVAIRGFEIGLPAVFSALSGQIEDKSLLAQAGVTVINSTANDGNMLGVMDVANSSVGPMLKTIDPNITSNILRNFNVPEEYFERDIGTFYDSFGASMTNLDPSWNQIQFANDMVPSLSNFDTTNSSIAKLFQAQNLESSVSFPLDGSVPIPSTSNFLSAGLSLGQQDVTSSLKNNFSGISLSGKTTSDSNFFFS